jgi:hypothetical protein
VADGVTYLYGSKLEKHPTGSNAFQIPADSPLSPFVNILSWQAFVVDTVPAKGEEAKMWKDDEWFLWFKVVLGLAEGSLRFTPTCWPLDTQLSSFAFTMKLGDKDIIVDTTAAAGALEVDQSSVDAVLKQGMLIFGLKASDSPPIIEADLNTISDLIDFPYKKAIKLIGGMKLKLDQSNKARNILWFSPKDSYKTTLRLQFTVTLDLVSPWIKKVVENFDINKISVIAKKKAFSVASSEGDKASSVGEMTLLLAGTILPKDPKPIAFTASLQFVATEVTLRIQYNGISNQSDTPGEDDLLSRLIGWLGKSVGIKELNLQDWLEPAKKIINAIKPRVLEISFGIDTDGNLQASTFMLFPLQISLQIGNGGDATKQPLIFMLDFSWAKHRGPFLKGRIWTSKFQILP